MGMESHVRLLGIMYILAGVLFGITGLMLLVFAGGFSGIAAWAENLDLAAGSGSLVVGYLGIFVTVLMLLLTVPSVVVGMGLMRFRPWARSLAMVVGVLHLANVPMGTVLAMYSFWVLLSPETEPLFSNPPLM